ncbi:MAG: Mu-like prophage major head subunit gpT family protein [Treponema sp.]|nr:Mu-like prophage major head subunit gpT family protein [Treponema sp.]
MAIVSNQTLNNLRTTVRGEFKLAFEKANAESVYKKLATEIKSSSASNTYGWLSKFPQMRKWVGDRVIKDLSEASYQITNELYEATLGVQRTDIEDDNLEQYATISRAMGQETSDFLDREVAKLLQNGFSNTCYDGQNFFDDEHPVYPNTDGTGTASLVSNIYKKTASDNGTPWFLLALGREIKPLIVQHRTGFELEAITDTQNNTVFMKDQYLYGIRYRGSRGYGLWQQAVASKADLDDTAFEKAYELMQSFKRDGGDPMGMRPTALVVPPSLQSAAEKILKRTVLDNGAGNTNYNKIELIVNPWLA